MFVLALLGVICFFLYLKKTEYDKRGERNLTEDEEVGVLQRRKEASMTKSETAPK